MLCVRVESCECRVWYSGQPPQCSIYLESGHRSPACPLSSLCRRCRQLGHMARECTQAWALQSLPSWNHLLHLTMLWLTPLLFRLCSCLPCSWSRSCSTCSCYPVTAPARVTTAPVSLTVPASAASAPVTCSSFLSLVCQPSSRISISNLVSTLSRTQDIFFLIFARIIFLNSCKISTL